MPGGSRINGEWTVTLNQLCWECPPKLHPTGKEGRREGRQEGRKAGRKEGQTKPGSLCDSRGRKASMRTSPKHPMKSKASKTKITLETKLKYCSSSFLPHCNGDRKGLYSHHLAVRLALSMTACLLFPLSKHWPSSDSKICQRMKQVMRTMPLRLRH